jgi:hypothetical protein
MMPGLGNETARRVCLLLLVKMHRYPGAETCASSTSQSGTRQSDLEASSPHDAQISRCTSSSSQRSTFIGSMILIVVVWMLLLFLRSQQRINDPPSNHISTSSRSSLFLKLSLPLCSYSADTPV